MSTNTSILLRLSDELLIHIVSYLSKDLFHVRRSHRRLLAASHDHFMEEHFRERHHVLSLFSMKTLVDITARYGQSIRTITINSTRIVRNMAPTRSPSRLYPHELREGSNFFRLYRLDAFIRSDEYNRLIRQVMENIAQHRNSIDVTISEEFGRGFGHDKLSHEKWYTFNTHDALVGILSAARRARLAVSSIDFKLCEEAHNLGHLDISRTLQFIREDSRMFRFGIGTTKDDDKEVLTFRETETNVSLTFNFEIVPKFLLRVMAWLPSIPITEIRLKGCHI